MLVRAVGLALTPAAASTKSATGPKATLCVCTSAERRLPQPQPWPAPEPQSYPQPAPLARALAPTPPLAHMYQGDFLKEADEDVGKMAAVLEAAPANMHMPLQQARPATDTRRARRHTPRKTREPRPAARPPHPPPTYPHRA